MNHDVVIALAEILASHEVTLVHGVANIQKRLQEDLVLDAVL